MQDVDILCFDMDSEDNYPGDNPNEKVKDKDKYKTLSQIKDWRKVLCNFTPTPFKYDSYTWNTVEHAYQAQKYKEKIPDLYYFSTLESETLFSKANGYSPKMLKKVHYFDLVERSEWNNKSDIIMKDLCYAKFSQHKLAKDVLLATNDAILIFYEPYFIHIPVLEEIRDQIRNEI